MLYGSIRDFARLEWLGEVAGFVPEAWPLPVFRDKNGSPFRYNSDDLTDLDDRISGDSFSDRIAPGHGEFTGINNVRSVVYWRCSLPASPEQESGSQQSPDVLF
ncbi:hypothetical protein GCM10009624_36290 [Gordonia sinesedis]